MLKADAREPYCILGAQTNSIVNPRLFGLGEAGGGGGLGCLDRVGVWLFRVGGFKCRVCLESGQDGFRFK